MTLNLIPGQTDLTGDFRDAKGKQIGSFFAYIRRLARE